MKKIALLFGAISMSTFTMAQKSKIYSAKEYMEDGNTEKAIQFINEAVNSDATRNDGDAWFTRGQIFEKLVGKDPNAKDEMIKSYMKVVEVKPNYNKDQINYKLKKIAFDSYNQAAGEFSGDDARGIKQDYNAAANSYKVVVDIRNINDGKQFASDKQFDTVAGDALRYQSFSAYNAKSADAIELMEKAVQHPIAKSANLYALLIEHYESQKNTAKVEQLLDEAKKAYPKDPVIANKELNYYITSKQTDKLIQKLEDAIKSNPNDPTLQYNLGVTYSSLANPVDANGTPLAKPEKAKEYFSKAEIAYKMAIDANPTNVDYIFNLGALYYQSAYEVTVKMNDITGTSPAEQKKYEELKKQRITEMTKSMPHFQKVVDLIEPKINAEKASEEERNTLRSTYTALLEIYEAFGQSEKGDEIAKKIQDL